MVDKISVVSGTHTLHTLKRYGRKGHYKLRIPYLSSMLKKGYFEPRKSEVRVYQKLGVPRFKRIMLSLFGKKYGNQFGWYPIHNRKDDLSQTLKAFRKQTKRNELAHLAVLIGLLALSLNLILKGETAKALLVILINIPFNVYPVMLQRCLRFRVEHIINHLDDR